MKSTGLTGDVQAALGGRPREQAAPAILLWAWIGIALAVLEICILAVWVAGPHFVPTDPGPDPLPDRTRISCLVAQGLAVAAGLWFVWQFLLRRWLRTGSPDATGMLALCWSFMWFWDPMMNYTSAHLLYNSHLVNFGAWTLGSTPGWTSPNGNLLPEPLLIVIPGYPLFCFGAVLMTHWVLQRMKPRLTKPQMIGAALIVLFTADTLIEVGLIRTGLYVFPGGIRNVTLFAGQPVQFPLTEALFCSLGWTATLLLLIYTDNNGFSFVERGVEQLAWGPASKHVLRFFALFGYTHLATLILWVAPNQWLATHSDPYPQGLPSYLINHMCVYGPKQDQCPGPGVAIPRPERNPF
jgi:hypothetical protein